MPSLAMLHLRILLLTMLSVVQAVVESDQQQQQQHDRETRELRPVVAKLARLPHRESVVKDSYVVMVHDPADVKPVLADYGIRPVKVYRYVLSGFGVDHLSPTLLDELMRDPRVQLVAEDGRLDEEEDVPESSTTSPTTTTTTIPPVQRQSPAVWNLDRIDGRGGDFEYEYRYDGSGVHVYIIDSGIRASHVEFEDRVRVDCFDEVGPCNTDTISHGTHVASIVGGRTYGVAKGVTLHDVRIRNGANELRWLFLFAAYDHIVAEKKRYPDRKMIANVSYSGTWWKKKKSIVQASYCSVLSTVCFVSARPTLSC